MQPFVLASRAIQLARVVAFFAALAVAGSSELLAQCACGHNQRERSNSCIADCSCGECDCCQGQTNGCVPSCGLSDCGCSNCAADLLSREHLFGDWLGARSGLAGHGVIVDLYQTIDLYQTNYYQGVASGGREQAFKYGGKVDYEFTFEGEKLGLNDGFFAFMHAETRYGEDVQSEAGALSFPNTAMVWPLPKDVTSISGLYAIQALNEKISLTAGEY